MEKTTRVSSWEKIQRGVKETEHLMGQKQYNLSMMKARQTLEYMVRCLGEQAGIIDGDLSATIEELLVNKWISKTTYEHYHTIRILGNRAIHEGNENAYDCNQAYHLLSQEVYTFANDYNARRKSAATSSRYRKNSRRKQNRKLILPFAMILALIMLIIIVVKIFSPDKQKDEYETPSMTHIPTTDPTIEVPETTVNSLETMAETTAAPVYRVSQSITDRLNVRAEPSTSGERIGTLRPGTVVEYLGVHDEQWIKIKFEDKEAYVSRQYIQQD